MEKPLSQVGSVLNPAGFEKPQQLHAAYALCWCHQNTVLRDIQNCITRRFPFVFSCALCLFADNSGISVAKTKHSQKESLMMCLLNPTTKNDSSTCSMSLKFKKCLLGH